MTVRSTNLRRQPAETGRDGLTGSGEFGAAEVIQTIAVAAAPVVGVIGNQIVKQRGETKRAKITEDGKTERTRIEHGRDDNDAAA